MAKQGIKRPGDEVPEKKKYKKEPLVPEIQGKAKNSNEKANLITASTKQTDIMVYNSGEIGVAESEKTISHTYPEIDNDLARDNLQNDIPEADLQSLN